MTVILGSDHAGWHMKASLKAYIKASYPAARIVDVGTDTAETPVDYPDIAAAFVTQMRALEGARGILICGSGVGMDIAANRHPHIRAALCFTPQIADLARRHNDANVLVLGARLLDDVSAFAILDAFLAAPFEGGRHIQRVEKLGFKGE